MTRTNQKLKNVTHDQNQYKNQRNGKEREETNNKNIN